MNSEHIVLWGRTLERLLIVLFSGLSLVLGWSLFKVRLLRDQTAEFTGKGWTIRLERVGPGIFFALFGVIGLVFSVSHPLNLDTNGNRDGSRSGSVSQADGLEITWAGGGQDVIRNELRAINTIEAVAIPSALVRPNPGEKEALDRAREILDARKTYLLRVELGDSLTRYETWKNDAEKDPSALSRLTKSQSDEFRKADDLAKGTFLGADK